MEYLCSKIQFTLEIVPVKCQNAHVTKFSCFKKVFLVIVLVMRKIYSTIERVHTKSVDLYKEIADLINIIKIELNKFIIEFQMFFVLILCSFTGLRSKILLDLFPYPEQDFKKTD